MHDAEVASVEEFRDNFDPFKIGPDNVWELTDYLVAKCPVAHGSDQMGDFYVLSKYRDVFNVIRDWQSFPSSPHAKVPTVEHGVEMLPIDANPPMHRHMRKILDPYFSPQKVAEYEPRIRSIITMLIDDFADKGRAELASALFRPLPPLLTFQILLGIQDPEEVAKARQWMHELSFEHQKKDVTPTRMALFTWFQEVIEQRRAAPRTDDIIDALLHGTVEEGRRLSNEEIIGALLVLLFGGFNTTTDATSNFMVRLLHDRELQSTLRREPDLLPKALEEHLRLMPPVPMLARLCAQDAEIHGRQIHAGDRVAWSMLGANHDPDEFETPDEFRIDRSPNRHLAFGGGVHRCIGSNFARTVMRILFDELLSRFSDIRIAEGSEIVMTSDGGGFMFYVVEECTVSFTPVVTPV